MEQSRFSSKLLWAAIAAQIISVCQLVGVFEKLGINAGTVGDVVACVLQVLTLLGVLHDPTSKNKF